MNNKERYSAKRFDTPNRSRKFTDKVYSGVSENPDQLRRETFATEKEFYPNPPVYNVYFGEMHGHTNFSDGLTDVDSYYTNIRDNAKLDFAALTDHDHGGIGKPELYGEIWKKIQAAAKKYYSPGKFTTILAYEKDSYPWYNNMVVYFNSHDADMIIPETFGEVSRKELEDILKRDDIIIVPHDTYHLEAGTDLSKIDVELFTTLIEIYSRGDSAEYFGTPYNECDAQCAGCFWQDALARGAKMGCIGGSDDHICQNGLYSEKYEGLERFPGITGVWAKENTVEGIFEALKARRCYGFMGPGRVSIDFRINGHYMGEEFSDCKDREIYFKIESDTEIKRVTIVKNERDYMYFRRREQFLFDYTSERENDCYYLRVELSDGRCAWTSPIWVKR